MPIYSNKDSEGCYYCWGSQGFKYHYDNNPDVVREIPGIGKLI
jgi:hypothetical protein